MSLQTQDFDYELPAGRIAQHPVEPRDSSRLLRLDRKSGESSHHIFRELPSLLRPDDLLVLNDTYVVPARFDLRRATGGKIEGLFLRELQLGQWEVMLKNAGRCQPGEVLAMEGKLAQQVLPVENLGKGLWRVEISPALPARDVLDEAGSTPLPPYIRRHEASGDEQDRRSYQTIYAQRPGAVAAPTAGLHFTPGVMADLAGRGIQIARVTLHVGMGTFLPVKADALGDHQMHAEWYELNHSAAEQIRSAKSAGRRIVAIGTTTVRVMETVAAAGPVQARQGWTDIFLYPPAEFRLVDALLTNFHLPRSTLLMLVAAFCRPGRTEGVGIILEAYRQAIANEYRFFSYGDAMLIE